jgi:hypothetical protein
MTTHQILMATHQNFDHYTSKLKVTLKSSHVPSKLNSETICLFWVWLQFYKRFFFLLWYVGCRILVFGLLYFDAAATQEELGDVVRIGTNGGIYERTICCWHAQVKASIPASHKTVA